MAKKQTRRSISVSRLTYERLKSFCEANHVSMSQFVETRVGDFLGESPASSGSVTLTVNAPTAPGTAPSHRHGAVLSASRPSAPREPTRPSAVAPRTEPSAPRPQAVPMTSAAARYAVEPPPPVIKQKAEQPAPKPAEKRADQIFTF